MATAVCRIFQQVNDFVAEACSSARFCTDMKQSDVMPLVLLSFTLPPEAFSKGPRHGQRLQI